MKRVFAFLLVMMMILSLAACNIIKGPSGSDGTTAPSASQQGQALVSKVGDTASFGSYDSKPIEWLCIAVQGDKALLVTKDCVTLDVFNEPMPGGAQVVWADSTLRAWLNGEFLNSLSADERAMILDTEHSSNENFNYADFPEYDVEWKTCTDKVFLLSATEANTYFADDESRMAKIILSDAQRSAIIARYEKVLAMADGTGADYVEELMKNGGAVNYWLRSNGSGYMVQTVSYDGNYDDYGANQDWAFLGVRPAVWISLTSKKIETGTPDTTKPSATTAATGSNEVMDFDIGISSIPAEWQKAIGYSMYGMNTGAKDGCSDSYINKFGGVSAEYFDKLIAYFDTLTYTEKLDGVYNCAWGQLQIAHNVGASELSMAWYAN